MVVTSPTEYPDGGAGMVMTVFGAAMSPVLVTVTVGVTELPGTTDLALTFRSASRTTPEQIDSATTTAPLRIASAPLSRVRSRPRTVYVSRPVPVA